MKRAILTLLAVGAFIVENSFDFVGSVPYFRRLNGGLGILDMLPLPDPERVHRALALLGSDGRRHYAVLLFTFDVLFPLTVALFFRAWLGRRLRWLPWVTLALDYAENAACAVLVASFPNESAAVASLQGVLTGVKFAGYAACIVAVLAVAAHSAIRTIRKRRLQTLP
ncbi:MAG TPA: hypothetical protein VFE90_15345 [Myxococcales bacterium]|jgi:hypothetical protein|nr:hypothetical protein [Myxococcales bacterium]